jgi:carboxyl-terminal processing protease
VKLDSSKKYVKRYLTAEFCRQLLGENQYYQVTLKEDPMIKEALK